MNKYWKRLQLEITNNKVLQLALATGLLFFGCEQQRQVTEAPSIDEQQFIKTETICGYNDNRTLSTIPEVGRLRGKSVCTATLIGRRCVLTAGHCTQRGTDDYVEFNTPESKNGYLVRSQPEDIYEVRRTIRERNGGLGNDFAVLQLDANEITGRFPGDVQGFYQVSLSEPAPDEEIQIAGYGVDYEDTSGARHLAQKTRDGRLTKVSSVLRYRVDTTGGNSGSAVLSLNTQRVIGVHTNGGCGIESGTNSGTAIYANDKLRGAIERCLERYDD